MPLTFEVLLHELFPTFVLFQVTSAAEEIPGTLVAANSVRINNILRSGRKDERVMSLKPFRRKKDRWPPRTATEGYTLKERGCNRRNLHFSTACQITGAEGRPA